MRGAYRRRTHRLHYSARHTALPPRDATCRTLSSWSTHTFSGYAQRFTISCRKYSSSSLIITSSPSRSSFENAPPVTMGTSDVSRQSPGTYARAWEVMRTAACLNPVIWCLRIYDDNFATKVRRPPTVHDLARRARGEPAIHALPRRRKRALTDPLPPLEPSQSMTYSVRRSRQRTDPQSMSSFMAKLPLELRQMIYAEVLAGGGCEVVHILRKEGRLGHWRCRLQQGLELCDAKGRRCVEGWLSYKTKVWHLDKTGRLDIITDDGLVPLLRSCRLM